MVQAYDNVVEDMRAKKEHLDLHSRIAKTMQNAGVAITITSITDFTVFAIGATTVSRVDRRRLITLLWPMKRF